MENEEESLNEEEIEKAVENEDESLEDSSLPTTPFEDQFQAAQNLADRELMSYLKKRTIKGQVKNAKGIADKKLLQLLFKHPMTWVVIGVVFIILFAAILIFAMDFDMFGKGIIRPTYYDTKCGKILLTWERSEYYEAHKNDDDYEPITDPALVDLEYEDSNHIKRWEYKEVDYDTYITNVIWTDNENAGIVENQTVYEAMGVAARSFLVSKLPSNCVVLRDYNPQSYTELDGSEDNYQDINKAVKATKGLIIGRERRIISALYDPFSYVFKRADGNEQDHFYHMMQVNNEEQQRIPANWVDQHKNIPITKVLTTKKFESMSLYGAKYLQEHEDYDYDIYRLLEYYYGTDIEYYTIYYEYSDNNPEPGPIANGCYVWPIGSIETTTENGVEVALGFPSSTKITSWFGKREAPTEGAGTNHGAIDISGNGTRGLYNIIAAEEGVITIVNNNCTEGNSNCGGGYGNYVKIDHGDGIETLYAHMQSVSVKVGDKVIKGQVLGKLGSTGRSTGPHLHFEVRDHGTKVNPLNYVSPNDPRPTNCGFNPIPGSDNKQITCLALKRAGYGDIQVAGMMANAEHESGFNPNAFNPGGGGIGAYGLFQWRAGRQKALKELKNYDTIEVQVAFAVSELNSGYKNANLKLINSTSASDASYNFCVYYEVPGRTTEEAQKNCVVRRTDGLADKHYKYVQNGCK